MPNCDFLTSRGIPTLPPLPPLGRFPPPLPPITSTHRFIQPPLHRPRPHLAGPHPYYHQPSDTLIVRKIPREQNTITKLSGHFEKFGTIVNLTVWYSGDPEGALVQFSNPFEARKAHDSADAVLNNRFIRIYYLRKDAPFSPHQLRETTLETPMSVAVSTIHTTTPSFQSRIPTTSGHVPFSPNHTPVALSPAPSPMSRANEISNTAPSPLSLPSSSSTTSTIVTNTHVNLSPVTKAPLPLSPSQRSYVSPNSTTHAKQWPKKARETEQSSEVTQKRLELQKKTRDLLQKEIAQQKLLISKLEGGGKHMSAEEKKKIKLKLKSLSNSISKLSKMATAALETKQKQVIQPHKPPFQPQAAAALKEKAQALRKEAHQLGLLSSPSQHLAPSPTPPTSQLTGGGCGPVKDLRSVLDRKPKRLLVLNVESKEQLIPYFESFGGLVQVEVDPGNEKNLIFTFRHAHIAQKVAKKTSTFNGKPLIMKWYTPKTPPLPPPPSSSSSHPPVSSTSRSEMASPTVVPPSVIPPSPSPSTPSSLPITSAAVSGQGAILTTPTLVTPTLTSLDPAELHLVEDDEEEESEGRSWRH